MNTTDNTSHLLEYQSGAYFDKKAKEYAATQTQAENDRRKANGRRQNVRSTMAILPGGEVNDATFCAN